MITIRNDDQVLYPNYARRDDYCDFLTDVASATKKTNYSQIQSRIISSYGLRKLPIRPNQPQVVLYTAIQRKSFE
jgi:hypothetical protein